MNDPRLVGGVQGACGLLEVEQQAEAAAEIQAGRENDLRDRLKRAPLLAPVAGRIDALLDPARHVGRAPQLVEEFFAAEVDPLLAPHADLVGEEGDVRV